LLSLQVLLLLLLLLLLLVLHVMFTHTLVHCAV